MTTPSRRGQPWCDEEIQQLLQEIKNKERVEQISLKHGRTSGGIHSRLKQIAADYYFNDNRPISEIIKFTGLDMESITDAISKRQYQMDLQEKKERDQPKITAFVQKVSQEDPPREGMVSLLKEIRDMMKEMLEILKKD